MRRIDLKKANVARSDTIRNINRQIVLNYVRERAPISRAEIAQETALQRSTISLIVDELKTQGLIEEFEGKSTGGRPPILLRLRAAEAVAVGIDLSTTATIIATSDLAGRVLEQEELVTDPDMRTTLDRIIACLRKLIEKTNGIEGIGVSLPGLVDSETGTALFIPYFKWRNWAVAHEIETAIGLPVTVDNDANAMALAELWFGRPEIREVRDFILILVEEGLGTWAALLVSAAVFGGGHLWNPNATVWSAASTSFARGIAGRAPGFRQASDPAAAARAIACSSGMPTARPAAR